MARVRRNFFFCQVGNFRTDIVLYCIFYCNRVSDLVWGLPFLIGAGSYFTAVPE